MPLRAGLLATALLLVTPGPPAADAQPAGVLHVTVTILDPDQRILPVPRHVLLISDNPESAPPRRAMTGPDGAADVPLRPGNYTVESDEPLILEGKAYQWRQTLNVAAGRVTPLALTAGNAEVHAAPAGAPESAGEPEVPGGPDARPAAVGPSALLMDRLSGVVAVWSSTARGGGFLVDPRGLVVTTRQLAGGASARTAGALEVQLSATDKVAARVLAADPATNLAMLWIDPKAAARARPVRIRYADGGRGPSAGDPVAAISLPIGAAARVVAGTLSRVTPQALLTDLRMDVDSIGAPLFNAAGEVIAITAPDDPGPSSVSADSRAVRIDEIRTLLTIAEKGMQHTMPPEGTKLPVEPRRPFDEAAVQEAMRRRSGSSMPYTLQAADFDVALITPALLYGRGGGSGGVARGGADAPQRALEDFGQWSDYVRTRPAVLMIRATPKLVEGFWTTAARAAARTQGVSLPPIRHIKAGFAGMRLSCGDAEVTPIHPLRIEQRLDEGSAVYEGLYVFEPAAIGPACGGVRLTLFSEKDPAKGDTRVVDPAVLERIRQDFASYRE